MLLLLKLGSCVDLHLQQADPMVKILTQSFPLDVKNGREISSGHHALFILSAFFDEYVIDSRDSTTCKL